MLRLTVADLGSPSYFVATAAVVLGFFAEEGIEMQPVEGSTDSANGLQLGTTHFFGGPAYAPLQGFPSFRGVKLLCALSQYSYWFMGLRKDLDIKRGDLHALKGYRISSSPKSPGKGLRHMLIEAGLDPDRGEVRIVNSPSVGTGRVFRASDGVVALERGISDGFWGNGMRMEMAVRAGVAKVHIDLRRGDGPQGARFYNFPALSATERFIDEKPEIAAGAVRAIVKAQQALKANPSLATEVGKRIYPEEEQEVISTLVERDAPFYSAGISQEAVDGLNKFCVSAGLLPEPVTYAQMVATQFRELWEN